MRTCLRGWHIARSCIWSGKHRLVCCIQHVHIAICALICDGCTTVPMPCVQRNESVPGNDKYLGLYFPPTSNLDCTERPTVLLLCDALHTPCACCLSRRKIHFAFFSPSSLYFTIVVSIFNVICSAHSLWYVQIAGGFQEILRPCIASQISNEFSAFWCLNSKQIIINKCHRVSMGQTRDVHRHIYATRWRRCCQGRRWATSRENYFHFFDRKLILYFQWWIVSVNLISIHLTKSKINSKHIADTREIEHLKLLSFVQSVSHVNGFPCLGNNSNLYVEMDASNTPEILNYSSFGRCDARRPSAPPVLTVVVVVVGRRLRGRKMLSKDIYFVELNWLGRRGPMKCVRTY